MAPAPARAAAAAAAAAAPAAASASAASPAYATLSLRRIPVTAAAAAGAAGAAAGAAAAPAADEDAVLVVALNRPERLNAMNPTFWRECRECFHAIQQDRTVRAIVLVGEGKCFSAGLDLNDMGLEVGDAPDPARRAFLIREHVMLFQESFTAIENCPQPVIAAIHGACIGGGIDLISACDVRYASANAFFSVKEVDVGLAADVGSLQRLPKIVGNESLLRELAFTGRRFDATEALAFGLVSRVLPDPAATVEAAIATARLIASKSPVAVTGTKRMLLYSRDHSVRDGLEMVATWNMAMLQTNDLMEAAAATIQKRPGTFAKL